MWLLSDLVKASVWPSVACAMLGLAGLWLAWLVRVSQRPRWARALRAGAAGALVWLLGLGASIFGAYNLRFVGVFWGNEPWFVEACDVAGVCLGALAVAVAAWAYLAVHAAPTITTRARRHPGAA